MNRESRDIGASVRAQLLERARAKRSDFQILLTRYALERLLYRLSVSAYRDRFILKGAMLFATWITDPYRSTRDLDLLGYGDSSPEVPAATFRTICMELVDDDGVVFDVAALESAPIREGADYGGVRIRTTATIGGARIPIQIDIGFGDIVTPAPIEIEYPVLLKSPIPHIRAYPVETVIAEKFEALITLGIANSRLKDFYDLWLISRLFRLNQFECVAAVRHTFERRGTGVPGDKPVGLTDEFAAAWAPRWQTFLARESRASVPNNFADVIADLRSFLAPLVHASKEEMVWIPGGPWSPTAARDN